MSRIKAKERRSSIGRQRLKSNQRPVKRAVRIVVEGIKTEKIYFNAVRRKGSLTATDVIVVDCGSDNSATQVVQRGLAILNSRDDVVDEVWCVFDREAAAASKDFLRACALAKTAKPRKGQQFELAISNPCFEVWVLLHFERSARPFANRSEEHTSELQSLMRISYAVFCLKKKNNNKIK